MRFALTAFLLLASPALADPVFGLPEEALGRADYGAPREGPPVPEGRPLRASEFDSPAALAAASVGRLDVLANGAVTRCAAFAATPDLLLTAPGCLPDGAERAVLLVGHDGLGPVRAVPLSPLPIERGERYVLLDMPLGTLPAAEMRMDVPDPATPLALIGFPNGGALRVIAAGCRAGHVPISGRRLTHRCAPSPGLAGAPLVDPASGAVLGMHLDGATPDALGFAVPARTILEASEALGGVPAQAADDAAVLASICEALAEAARACDIWEAVPFCEGPPRCDAVSPEPNPAPLPFVTVQDADLPGADLGDAAFPGTTLSACETACRREPACTAFTFRDGLCRLKASRAEPARAPGTISGWPASEP